MQYGPQWDNYPNDFNISKSCISLIITGNLLSSSPSFIILAVKRQAFFPSSKIFFF